MTQVSVTRCQYCGSQDIGEGWQHGEALVTFKYHGLLGNRLKYLICRRCGAVLYQCWQNLTGSRRQEDNLTVQEDGIL